MSSTWLQPSHFLEIIYENPGLAMNLLNNRAKVKISNVCGRLVGWRLRVWLTNCLGVYVGKGLMGVRASCSFELNRAKLWVWRSDPTTTTSACLDPRRSLQSLSPNFWGSRRLRSKQWRSQQRGFLPCGQLRRCALSPRRQPIDWLREDFDFIPTFQPATHMKLAHFPSSWRARLMLGLHDTKELKLSNCLDTGHGYNPRFERCKPPKTDCSFLSCHKMEKEGRNGWKRFENKLF